MKNLYLKNIALFELSDKHLLNLAKKLGCNYRIPIMRRNPYSADAGLLYVEEQNKINDEWHQDYKKYINDVIYWLKDNGYVEEKDKR